MAVELIETHNQEKELFDEVIKKVNKKRLLKK